MKGCIAPAPRDERPEHGNPRDAQDRPGGRPPRQEAQGRAVPRPPGRPDMPDMPGGPLPADAGPAPPGRPARAAVAAVVLLPGAALAQTPALEDEAAQRQAAADLWSGLFVAAALAFAVHLVLRGRGARAALRDMAKALAFLASAYLAGFFFLGSVSAIARFLLAAGMERDLSVLLAVPLGVVVAYRLHTAYERWRVPK